MKTTTRIQKMTSKGQVTLPSVWRRIQDADHVFVETKKNAVIITPAYPEKLRRKTQWYTVFDAIRDNKGKGLRADEVLRALKKLNRYGQK